MSDISTKGSSFTIRKFREEPFTPVDLIETNTFSKEMLSYLWLCMENRKNLTVGIDYQRYTPARSFDITGYPLLRIDVYDDSSNYSTSLSISTGATNYEWAPLGIDWFGWRTLSFALSEASAAGVDPGAVDAVRIKIQEPGMVGNMSINKTGTVHYDYLRASN